MLGGIDIPFYRGLDGWSDADVLTHAIMDALLGAAALGDIGQHFPSGDMQYKDISSLTLLANVRALLAVGGWTVVNIDATVVAEGPKLQPYIGDMRRELSQALGLDAGQVSVKASSNNGLGDIGQGEGIAAYAIALIESGK